MGSLNSALLKKALAKGVVGMVVDDTPVAIRLKYIGTGTVTSVTVDTGTDLVMITSDGGTDTYDFGTYTTIGALVDAINGDGIFEAKVLDSIRSEATATQFVDGAISSSTLRDGGVSTTIWDVLVDTDAADYIAYRLTYDRGFEREAIKKGHTVSLREIVYYMTMGTASTANSVRVYEIDGTTETQIARRATGVTQTETTINWASGEGFISAAVGNDLVIYVTDAAFTDDAGNYLEVTGLVE